MKWMLNARFLSVGLIAVAMGAFVGCTGDAPPTAEVNAVSDDHDHGEHGDHQEHDEEGHEALAAHQQGEWWCGEHGVPEGECPRCDTSLVAKFKESGDWCDDHNRPDSQCFVCSPENFEKFAALYEAKYGERPESPTE